MKLFESLPLIGLELSAENTRGLPEVYNEAIDKSKSDPAILLFSHDDIQIPDIYLPNQVHAAMKHFDIAGVAGNTRRLPAQPSWYFSAFSNNRLVRDEITNLSGIVMHGNGFPECKLSYYGRPGKSVKLLDGLLLITKSDTLHKHELRFDPLFKFHFYDMDLCRQAESKNLIMGTWPITVIHGSAGDYTSTSWKESYIKYLNKYGEHDVETNQSP
ncbi:MULTISPECIES: glycosyltransferase [Methylococcus]|uniref:Glycosyltransferase family protein n=1 Tax=Methylococcus capsulatus TaxID=414 RepID=A0ABZ2F2J1_METCP|nr:MULTISPECIES: glycosyltransferase [Methylococcus]